MYNFCIYIFEFHFEYRILSDAKPSDIKLMKKIKHFMIIYDLLSFYDLLSLPIRI